MTAAGETSRDTNRDMTRLDLAELAGIVAEQPYPLVFATVSGAHLYGFPSRDSDVDLRGAHLLPLPEVVGLRTGPETLDRSWTSAGMEVDLVTHDATKFFRLLLRRNGYVLEQLLSPLVVTSSDLHAELVALAPGLVTRHHAHHYRGFARSQRRLFLSTGELKPLLYTFRVLLTGIHLMRTGEVQANLARLNETVRLSYLDDLIGRKVGGTEKERLTETDLAFHRGEYDRLRGELEEAGRRSALPESPQAADALHHLLVRLRLGTRGRDCP